MCSIQEQSSTIGSNKELFYDGCSKKEESFTKCSKQKQDKSCQTDKNAHMQPVKPAMDMWSNRPAVPKQMSQQQIVPQEDDKNCQVNIRPAKSIVYSDKKCQETKFM